MYDVWFDCVCKRERERVDCRDGCIFEKTCN